MKMMFFEKLQCYLKLSKIWSPGKQIIMESPKYNQLKKMLNASSRAFFFFFFAVHAVMCCCGLFLCKWILIYKLYCTVFFISHKNLIDTSISLYINLPHSFQSYNNSYTYIQSFPLLWIFTQLPVWRHLGEHSYSADS